MMPPHEVPDRYGGYNKIVTHKYIPTKETVMVQVGEVPLQKVVFSFEPPKMPFAMDMLNPSTDTLREVAFIEKDVWYAHRVGHPVWTSERHEIDPITLEVKDYGFWTYYFYYIWSSELDADAAMAEYKRRQKNATVVDEYGQPKGGMRYVESGT